MNRAFLAALVLCATSAFAVPLPPAPKHYVTDRVNALKPDVEQQLEAKLAQYERDTSHQFIVYIDRRVPNGTTLEEMSAAAIKTWGVGQKEKDNGLILFLFVHERVMRIEVGYGLEGDITDARAKRVTSTILRPRLQQKDYAGAIDAALEPLMAWGRGEAWPASKNTFLVDAAGLLSPGRAQALDETLADLAAETTDHLYVSIERTPPDDLDTFVNTALASRNGEHKALLLIYTEPGIVRLAASDSLSHVFTPELVNTLTTSVDLDPQLARIVELVRNNSGHVAAAAIVPPQPPPPDPGLTPADIFFLIAGCLFFGTIFILLLTGKIKLSGGSGFGGSSGGSSSSSSGFSGGGGSGGGGGASDRW